MRLSPPRSESPPGSTNCIGGVHGGIPGALTNQPPLESAIPENAVGGQKQSMPSRKHLESTKNYELDEAISHTKQQAGVVRRVSVSVALDYVNGVPATSGDGASQTSTASIVPRSAAELANIRRLLQGSIGFDLQRGDVLEVVTIPFNRPDFAVAPELPIWQLPAAGRVHVSPRLPLVRRLPSRGWAGGARPCAD